MTVAVADYRANQAGGRALDRFDIDRDAGLSKGL
jgi:hypothetical protein